MLTGDIMRSLWPNGDAAISGLIEGMVAAAPIVFPKYGLISDMQVAHAMAQFSEECGAGHEVVENLDGYTASRLMEVWPGRFNATLAASCAGNGHKIADVVYNGRMGNRPGTDDGWNFRGRGGSQVTGRDGHGKLGQKVGLDLLNSPDQINTPQHFLECAVADFVLCGCLPFATSDDVSGVTYHLNGGYIGLSDRSVWLAKWKAALGVGGADSHGTLWVQHALNVLGASPSLKEDGSYGPTTAAAVRAFQQAHGLAADGKMGPPTIAAIQTALG
jgi:putative chitinase